LTIAFGAGDIYQYLFCASRQNLEGVGANAADIPMRLQNIESQELAGKILRNKELSTQIVPFTFASD
jgi:hypothetical protein